MTKTCLLLDIEDILLTNVEKPENNFSPVEIKQIKERNEKRIEFFMSEELRTFLDTLYRLHKLDHIDVIWVKKFSKNWHFRSLYDFKALPQELSLKRDEKTNATWVKKFLSSHEDPYRRVILSTFTLMIKNGAAHVDPIPFICEYSATSIHGFEAFEENENKGRELSLIKDVPNFNEAYARKNLPEFYDKYLDYLL